MSSNLIPKNFVEECKKNLIEYRAEILNQIHGLKLDFDERERGGDEVDQSLTLLSENRMLIHQRRTRSLLLEIDQALDRIEKGSFGICEETGEIIKLKRLKAIPWTRLSLEGAEIREESQSARSRQKAYP